MSKLKAEDKPFEISKWLVWDAYKKVKANKGAPGVDGQAIEQFERDLENNLYGLWNRLSSGTYFPPPVKAVEIPKPGGRGIRVLGIPSVSDRIAQTAAAMVLERRVEPIFHPDSYGYRPGRSALDAVGMCRERCWKYNWAIDLDVQAFFDNVDHNLLVRAVERHLDTATRWVLLYVRRWLVAPLQTADGTLQARDRGTPQGSATSPVFRRICSCTMRSISGCPGNARGPLSNGTAMTRWFIASARATLSGSWPISQRGWPRSGCSCIRPRPGSCTARTPAARVLSSTRASRSWDTHSGRDWQRTGKEPTSWASLQRSAETP